MININKFLRPIILISSLLALTANANCLTGQLNPSSADNIWYATPTLTITNNCTTAQTLDGIKVSFTSQDINNHPVIEPSAMWGTIYSSSSFTNIGNQASATLIGTQPLAPKAQAILKFTVSLVGADFNYPTANQNLNIGGVSPRPINNGEIDLTINPANVDNKSQRGEIDIYNSTAIDPYRVIKVTDWQTISHQRVLGLPYDGAYKIIVKSVDEGNTLGYAAPASFALNSATPQVVNITYQPKPATGTLKLELGNPPMVNVQSEVKVMIKDDATQQNWVENLNWNSATNVTLPAGAVHQYTVTVPTVTNGIQTAAPKPISQPIFINKNTSTTLPLSFLPPVNNPKQSVSFKLGGLPNDKTATLIISDDYNNQFSKNNLNNGTTVIQLPVNDSFQVNATASGFYANINPFSFSLSINNQPPMVSVQFSKQPVVQATFQAFADSGTQSQFDSGSADPLAVGLVPPRGGSLTEGFGLLNTTGNTDIWAISGAFGGTPTLTSNYLRMHGKANKAFLSIGGASSGAYGYPWDWDANKLKYKELQKDAVQDIETLIKYYSLQGVDFDFEGADVDNKKSWQWIADVAYDLRQDNPNLLLSLTVSDYVMYQDNNDVNHIYAYGPVITSLIQQTLQKNNGKMVFNFINKMAFDLGDQSYNDCSQTGDITREHVYVLQNGDKYYFNDNCLIMSAQTAAIQLARMLNISTAQAWQYVGEIFMPVEDDMHYPLPLGLATAVASKLHQMGVNHMGYWSVQRDYNYNPDLEFGNMYTQTLGLRK